MKVGDVLALLSAFALLIPTVYVTVLSIVASRGVCRAPANPSCKVSVIIPVYREPLENVKRTVFSVVEWAHEIVVVWDDPYPGVERELTRAGGGKLRFIARRGRRGKASALNEGLKIASGDYILVLDAGDTVSGDYRELCGCCSVIGSWIPRERRRGILEAVGTALTYLRAATYRGRCLKGLPVFFLGTGSAVSGNLATLVGGWREDAVLEDVEFGFRIIDLGGCSPCYTDNVTVHVEVPPSYLGLRVQQARWIRGVGQIIAMKWWRSVDQLLYVIQYPLQVMWHPLLLISLLTGVSYAIGVTVFAAIVAGLILAAVAYVKALSSAGTDTVKALRLGGGVAALGLLLTPTLLAAFIDGLLGSKTWGPPTPRRRQGFSVSHLYPEAIYAVASTIATLASWPNPLALVAALYPVSLAYVVLRYHDELA